MIDEPFEKVKSKKTNSMQFIKEFLIKCGNTTHILRLNWSTDGQLLISSNAIKGNI